jgi:hypothetical protein
MELGPLRINQVQFHKPLEELVRAQDRQYRYLPIRIAAYVRLATGYEYCDGRQKAPGWRQSLGNMACVCMYVWVLDCSFGFDSSVAIGDLDWSLRIC